MLFNSHSQAQSSDLAVGQWKSHQSFSQIVSLAQSDEYIFAAGQNDVLKVYKEDNSLSIWDKTNVLSGSDISAIAYEPQYEVLAVGYESGVIDLVYPDKTITLTDLERANVQVLKRINRIKVFNGNLYLCTNVGVLEINTQRSEISETFRIAETYSGNGVLDITVFNGMYYIAAESGVYSASTNNQFLNQFSSWEKENVVDQEEQRFNSIVTYQGKVIANFNSSQVNGDKLYALDGGVWGVLNIVAGINSPLVRVSGDKLIVVGLYEGLVYNSSLERETRVSELDGSFILAKDAIWYNNQLYVATERNSLVHGNSNVDAVQISPNAPYTNSALGVTAENGKVCVSSGSLTASYNNIFTQNGFYQLENGFWENLNSSNVEDFKNVFDCISTAIDPNNPNHIYATMWGGGLMEFLDGEQVERYTPENSILQYHGLRSDNYTPTIAAKFDNTGALWFVNAFTNKPLVRKSGDTWNSFAVQEEQSNGIFLANDIAFRIDNTVWMSSPRGVGGVQVFGHNGTFDNTADDQFKHLVGTPGLGGLPSTSVFCVEEDLDGQIWVGTDEGFAIFTNPDAVFDGTNFDATQPIIEQDGNFEIILGTEQINTIAVDGGNRKWMGTQTSGVYLLDKTGYEVIRNFNTENSPLLSNTVYDIAVDGKTGEVYFATAKGIQSYRSEATSGGETIANINTFPNPVRPGYEGDITISGLVRDTKIKITDVSGRLVFETTSNGGQATWNGLTITGDKPPQGMYLIFATTTDGEDAGTGKLMFLR